MYVCELVCVEGNKSVSVSPQTSWQKDSLINKYHHNKTVNDIERNQETQSDNSGKRF